MYDGREFDWCNSIITLGENQDIEEFIKSRIETECYSDRDEDEEEDDKPQWEHGWFTDNCGSAFKSGSYYEVTFKEYQVLKKYFH